MERKNNQYSIYGNDNQEAFDNLNNLSDEIDKLVTKKTTIEIKKRQKQKEKKKLFSKDKNKVIREHTLMVAPEELQDVNDEATETVDKSEMVKSETPPHRKGLKIFLLVVSLFILLSIGLIGYTILTNYENSNQKTTENTSSFIQTNPIDDTSNKTVDNETNSVIGRIIEPTINTKDDIVRTINELNTIIVSYLQDAKDLALNKGVQTDKNDFNAEQYVAMLNLDIEKLSASLDMFKTWKMEDYINNSILRLKNIQDFFINMKDVGTVTDSKTIYTLFNHYALIDNGLTETTKESILNCLTNNNIQYNYDDEEITITEISNEDVSENNSEIEDWMKDVKINNYETTNDETKANYTKNGATYSFIKTNNGNELKDVIKTDEEIQLVNTINDVSIYSYGNTKAAVWKVSENDKTALCVLTSTDASEDVLYNETKYVKEGIVTLVNK